MQIKVSQKKLLSRFKDLRFTTLLVFLAFISFLNFRKYGISWEAPGLRLNGGNAAIYIADKVGLNVVPDYYRQFAPMGENGMADHGVAYDLPLVILERFFQISDSMQIYQFRTLVNSIVFIIGTFSVFQLGKRRFSSANIGLLASIFFVLSPRIFAAGFYSPSDMVFTSFFALGVNLSIKFLQDQRIATAILAGLACGYATDIRLLGIIALPIFTSAYILHMLQAKHRRVKPLLAYFLSFATSIYLFFPYLWEDPVRRFIEVFQSLSRYNWGGTNLYFGEHIPAADLPWHYIPVWILITTPILYSILFLLGSFGILRKLFVFRDFDFQKLQDYIFLGLATLPVLMVIFLNSVLYDSWRHLFFIYPFFILVGVNGWVNVLAKENRLSKKYLIKASVTVICLCQILVWMVSNNPRQYLYFNFLAGQSSLQEKWEMDYLGLSNKDVIEELLTNDKRDQLSVAIASFTPFDMSLKVVPEKFRDRIVIVPLNANPDYIVNNFRGPVPLSRENLASYKIEKRYIVDKSIYFEVWKRK